MDRIAGENRAERRGQPEMLPFWDFLRRRSGRGKRPLHEPQRNTLAWPNLLTLGQARRLGHGPTGERLTLGQYAFAGPAAFDPGVGLKYRAGWALRLLACATIWLAVVMTS
jgi:hypothetical protein